MPKRILGLSKASYRCVSLYELPLGAGVGFFLGTAFIVADTLEQATAAIDVWYDLKKN